MDRDTLKTFLSAGPTRKFDLGAITAKLEEQEDAQRLFRSRSLNRAIFLKYLDTDDQGQTPKQSPVRTLVYLPFDPKAPQDGGQSFFYSRERFTDFSKNGKAFFSIAQEPEDLQRDADILDVFTDAPTFNPFLLHDAFERSGYALEPAFFNVDPHHVHLVKTRIKNRIRPIIIAALENTNGAMDRSLDTFAARIWENKELDRIRPLIKALDLPEHEAGDIFHSWCGITYFEEEFVALAPHLKRFAVWLSENRRPRESLTGEAAELIDNAASTARKRYRATWVSAVETLQAYQRTFESFVGRERNITPFIDFMRDARQHFWTLGAALGRLEQSAYAWRTFAKGYDGVRLPFDRLNAFYQVINQTQ
ncbi:MAG: hypothetical protein AAGC95_03245 [Pseudomonadota bacterium]